MKKKQIVGIVIAALILVFVGTAGVLGAGYLRNQLGATLSSEIPAPSDDSIAVISITGTIDATTYDSFGNPVGTYVHDDVLALIKSMTESETNKGLFLYIDSPGGSVFETDEVYLALQNYKETTGRPIYAYAHSMMASGGYYIGCAADTITANKNATVGSIGVYIQSVNYAGLYDKLGISGEYIKSGENKAMGNSFSPLTDEQRAIYQSIVDETYEEFLSIVCSSRGYTREQALPIADGRIYTSSQGLSIGLIDKLSTFDEAMEEFKTQCGADSYYWPTTQTSFLSSIFGAVEKAIPKSEAEQLLELADTMESGVPMYYAG